MSPTVIGTHTDFVRCLAYSCVLSLIQGNPPVPPESPPLIPTHCSSSSQPGPGLGCIWRLRSANQALGHLLAYDSPAPGSQRLDQGQEQRLFARDQPQGNRHCRRQPGARHSRLGPSGGWSAGVQACRAHRQHPKFARQRGRPIRQSRG